MYFPSTNFHIHSIVFVDKCVSEIDVAMNEYQDHEEAAEGTNSMWEMGQAEGSDDQTGKKKKKKKKKDKKIEIKQEYDGK